MQSLDVVVIGAGLSGLIVTQALTQQGKRVLCVDKARGSGGRLSSKRLPAADEHISFDLGCSAFNAKSDVFQKQVSQWCEQGHLAPWLSLCGETQYVGVPRSSSVTRAIANEVNVEFGVRIHAIVKVGNSWHLYTEESGHETLFAYANEIVIAAPAAQSYALLPSSHPLKPTLENAVIHAQWVAMFAFTHPLSVPDLCHQPCASIERISYENSKPGRINEVGLHVYCVQASIAWSEARLDYSKDKITHELSEALFAVTNKTAAIKNEYVHRWLYSQGSEYELGEAGFLQSDDGIYICGDYLLANSNVNGVEAAYLSAHALSQAFSSSSAVAYQ